MKSQPFGHCLLVTLTAAKWTNQPHWADSGSAFRKLNYKSPRPVLAMSIGHHCAEENTNTTTTTAKKNGQEEKFMKRRAWRNRSHSYLLFLYFSLTWLLSNSYGIQEAELSIFSSLLSATLARFVTISNSPTWLNSSAQQPMAVCWSVISQMHRSLGRQRRIIKKKKSNRMPYRWRESHTFL